MQNLKDKQKENLELTLEFDKRVFDINLFGFIGIIVTKKGMLYWLIRIKQQLTILFENIKNFFKRSKENVVETPKNKQAKPRKDEKEIFIIDHSEPKSENMLKFNVVGIIKILAQSHCNYFLIRELIIHFQKHKYRNLDFLHNEGFMSVFTDRASYETIDGIAAALRKMGIPLSSPKKLIDPQNSSITNRGKIIKNNINYLMTFYNIDKSYLREETGISSGELTKYMINERQPRYNNLKKIYKAFIKKKVPLESLIDLIYFPNNGETERTYKSIQGCNI